MGLASIVLAVLSRLLCLRHVVVAAGCWLQKLNNRSLQPQLVDLHLDFLIAHAVTTSGLQVLLQLVLVVISRDVEPLAELLLDTLVRFFKLLGLAGLLLILGLFDRLLVVAIFF